VLLQLPSSYHSLPNGLTDRPNSFLKQPLPNSEIKNVIAISHQHHVLLLFMLQYFFPLKMTISWDIVPCSVVKIDRCFRDAYCLQRQDYPDDGGSKHLWNVSQFPPGYLAQHHRRQSSSYSPPWEREILPVFPLPPQTDCLPLWWNKSPQNHFTVSQNIFKLNNLKEYWWRYITVSTDNFLDFVLYSMNRSLCD
jgi:hypothetical protein